MQYGDKYWNKFFFQADRAQHKLRFFNKSSAKYDTTNYFYSQSYWDRFDKTLLFTDSYWSDYISCENWLKSKKRKDILESYGEYFKVETTYNVLLDKMAEDVFLL